jgi:hypothetical protein
MPGGKAEGMRFTINLVTPDNGEKFLIELENATLTNIKGFLADLPDLTLTINRSDLEQMLQMWTTKGDYVNAAGQKFRAHDLIRQQLGKPRPNDGRKDVTPADSSLRFIAPRLVWISAALICPGNDCRSTNYTL